MGWHGGHLVVADRWFPSSKKCSSCKKAKATLSLGRGPTAASIVVWSSTGTTTQHATLPPTARSTSSPGVARRLKTDAEAMLGVPATPVHTPRKALVAGSLKTAPGNRRRPSPPLRKGRRRECACNYCTLDRNGPSCSCAVTEDGSTFRQGLGPAEWLRSSNGRGARSTSDVPPAPGRVPCRGDRLTT